MEEEAPRGAIDKPLQEGLSSGDAFVRGPAISQTGSRKEETPQLSRELLLMKERLSRQSGTAGAGGRASERGSVVTEPGEDVVGAEDGGTPTARRRKSSMVEKLAARFNAGIVNDSNPGSAEDRESPAKADVEDAEVLRPEQIAPPPPRETIAPPKSATDDLFARVLRSSSTEPEVVRANLAADSSWVAEAGPSLASRIGNADGASAETDKKDGNYVDPNDSLVIAPPSPFEPPREDHDPPDNEILHQDTPELFKSTPELDSNTSPDPGVCSPQLPNRNAGCVDFGTAADAQDVATPDEQPSGVPTTTATEEEEEEEETTAAKENVVEPPVDDEGVRTVEDATTPDEGSSDTPGGIRKDDIQDEAQTPNLTVDSPSASPEPSNTIGVVEEDAGSAEKDGKENGNSAAPVVQDEAGATNNANKRKNKRKNKKKKGKK